MIVAYPGRLPKSPHLTLITRSMNRTHILSNDVPRVIFKTFLSECWSHISPRISTMTLGELSSRYKAPMTGAVMLPMQQSLTASFPQKISSKMPTFLLLCFVRLTCASQGCMDSLSSLTGIVDLNERRPRVRHQTTWTVRRPSSFSRQLHLAYLY